MYRDFRSKFPELARAADTRHVKTWDSVEDDTAFSWFESLAGVINDQMEAERQGADLALVFSYFEEKLSESDEEVVNCIDVSFVENLFWRVKPKSAVNVWPKMPNSLQKLYLNFHGRPPIED
ncbi:MAG: hypothetical protein BM559_01855 [Roseobacter sp. MedPE-SWchi]|nr:MAG: hypothetical protein BM559_01855 [Roseobacter sp. MedPE-SWchi]